MKHQTAASFQSRRKRADVLFSHFQGQLLGVVFRSIGIKSLAGKAGRDIDSSEVLHKSLFRQLSSILALSLLLLPLVFCTCIVLLWG